MEVLHRQDKCRAAHGAHVLPGAPVCGSSCPQEQLSSPLITQESGQLEKKSLLRLFLWWFVRQAHEQRGRNPRGFINSQIKMRK